jgi:4-diphosphocytidyl-2-C-methyl-D-erythritol kinase
MVLFPNCKINLGLKILRKRADGYHDLDTVFYPLPFRDVLEIIPSPTLQFTATGLTIPGDPAGNLCVKAFNLLKTDFPDLPAIHIYLHKHIPVGAGLGGGSSDGAMMLLLLDRRFHLGLEPVRLQDYAARLGSDCPFFLVNKPCVAAGRGERLQPIDLDLSGYSFVIVNPGLHIGTADAFAHCVPDERGAPVSEIIRQSPGTWREALTNDFETPLFHQYPMLRSIKQQLYNQGAVYASMTGSGSGIFGIFEKDRIPSLIFERDYQVITLT